MKTSWRITVSFSDGQAPYVMKLPNGERETALAMAERFINAPAMRDSRMRKHDASSRIIYYNPEAITRVDVESDPAPRSLERTATGTP